MKSGNPQLKNETRVGSFNSGKPAYAYGSDAPDRLSSANPGPDMPCSPARGLLLAMLERFPIPEIRAFWQAHPVSVGGKELSETEGYEFVWNSVGTMTHHYWEVANHSFEAFLWRHGILPENFYDSEYFRFDQGGIWTAAETIAWIKDFLPKLYLDPEPMFTIEQVLCGWGDQAVPGSSCQIPFLNKTGDRIETLFSFAPDAEFRFRSNFFFNPTILAGMRIFPNFFGLPSFEVTRMVADCRHPDHLLWNTRWEIRDGVFYIEDAPYGTLMKFSEWAAPMNLRFQGTPVPDREIILMEKDFRCSVRNSIVLEKGCLYDAPLFLVRIDFPRQANLGRFGNSQVYLDNVLSGVGFKDSEAWRQLEGKYARLLDAAREKLVFEYQAASKAISLNGKTLISGVPAQILRKILTSHQKGQASFDFRAFKNDREIFPNPKESSFETRWNRLREKLNETTSLVRVEKTGKGEFEFNAACPVELIEVN